MAGGRVSDAFADMIVKALVTRDVSVLPSSYFFGLTLELPSDDNGTGLVAPTPDEYLRVEVLADDTSWVSSGVGSRMMVNDVSISFPLALIDWGNVVGYTMYDSLVDGVFLGYGLLNPYIITAGLRPVLPAGTVAIRLPV